MSCVAVQDMQEVVAMCLQTDPKDRPTAAKLLKHRFFKFIKEPRLAAEEVLARVPGPVKRLDSLNRRRMEAKRSGLDAGEMQYLGEDLSVNNVRVSTSLTLLHCGPLFKAPLRACWGISCH